MPKARAKKAHRKTPKSYTTEDWKKIYRKSKRHVPASMRGGSGGGARQQWWMPLAHAAETTAAAGGLGFLAAKKGADYRIVGAPVELVAAVATHGLAFAGSTMGWGKAFAPHLHALGDGALAVYGYKMGAYFGVAADQRKALKKGRVVIDTSKPGPEGVTVAEAVEPAKVGADEYGYGAEDEYGYGYAGAESIAADPEG